MPTISMPSHHDLQLIEQAEARYNHDFLAGATDATRTALGIHTARIGDGFATAVTADASGYWTKAMGLGFETPVNDALVLDTIDFFRRSGKDQGLFAIAPMVLPPDWERICAANGITAGPATAKFTSRVEALVPRPSAVAVRPLVSGDVPAWGRITREAFGMTDPDLTPLLATLLDDRHVRAFGVWDGDLLVGVAAVHLLGDVAALHTAGTLEPYRGRGIQSALLAARIEAAAAAGCRILSAETGAGTGPSSRNLARAGLVHLYDRVSWRWSA